MTHNRSECQLGHAKCQPANLAQVIHCDARHSDVPAAEIVKALADGGNVVGLDWFYKATADGGRALAPAWLLLRIAQITGRYNAITYLAREAGLITFAPLFRGGLLSRALSPLARSFAQFCETFEAAHEDGVYTADEARALTHRAHEHAAELFARVNAVRAAAGLEVVEAPAAGPDRATQVLVAAERRCS